MKKILLTAILSINLFANDCSPYYNPQKFYEAPEGLVELLEENFPNGIFTPKSFKEQEEKEKNIFVKKDSYEKFKDYLFPIKRGLWKYKLEENKVSEVSFAKVEIYRFSDMDIAQTVNDDLDNFWNDFNQDAYEMQLTPEQTLFRYNDTYFTMSVFIHGTKGDATPLKGTVVNFWLKDYTKEVNTHIECSKGKNDSWW